MAGNSGNEKGRGASRTARFAWVAALGLVAAAPASAATLPFTEEFAVDASGWVNAVSAPLDYHASGGADGGAYVSTSAGAIHDPGTILFRGSAGNGASGGAFVGDWSQVTVLSAMVIHDAPDPVTFFFRIAAPANFPGHVGVVPVAVAPGTWTEISVAIDPANPFLIAEGGSFAGTFSNVGNLQIGVSVPSALEGVPFTFGLDRVAIVPEPSTAGLLALGLATLATRRRARPRR